MSGPGHRHRTAQRLPQRGAQPEAGAERAFPARSNGRAALLPHSGDGADAPRSAVPQTAGTGKSDYILLAHSLAACIVSALIQRARAALAIPCHARATAPGPGAAWH